MKLYFSPGACSIGIHVLLEEVGTTYDLEQVTLSVPPPERALTAVNAKSKVPTLRLADGTVLTEFGAIATYIARTHPTHHLIPADPLREARVIGVLDYAVGTIHAQGFARLFRAARFAPSDADADAVKAQGRGIVEAGFALMEKHLAGQDYVAGEFSIADAALFYVEFWGAGRMGMTLPENCAAHLARMKARPAVATVLKQEGLI